MKWLRALPPSVNGDIELNFIDHKGLHVQAMALDCRTIVLDDFPITYSAEFTNDRTLLSCKAVVKR